ncbi:hypothetical protein GCM10010302_06870 [Streptomyces polychromogenes]|uniref:STAS domain-containing protein n=1 Tax=Streptomyces polychromogenes TaxID=67342 RepID=A0ABN0V2C7_9ACTN
MVVCSGEFDTDTIGVLREDCDEDAPADLLVVDVARVAFADSSFLSALVRLGNTRSVFLQGPLPHHLRRVMELTRALALSP